MTQDEIREKVHLEMKKHFEQEKLGAKTKEELQQIERFEIEYEIERLLAEEFLPSIGAKVVSEGGGYMGEGYHGSHIAFELKGHRFILTIPEAGHFEHIWRTHDYLEELYHKEEQQALADDSPNIPFKEFLAKRPSQFRKAM